MAIKNSVPNEVDVDVLKVVSWPTLVTHSSFIFSVGLYCLVRMSAGPDQQAIAIITLVAFLIQSIGMFVLLCSLLRWLLFSFVGWLLKKENPDA